MKKILISDDNLPYLICGINHKVGGAAVQAFSWLHGFIKNNYEVEVISSVKINNNSKVKMHLYTQYGKSYFKILFRFIAIYKILKKTKPDIVFSTTAGINTFHWGILKKIIKFKYVQRISNDIVYERKTYKKKLGTFTYTLSKIGIKGADLILCQNDYQIINIKMLGIKTKIVKIYNPFYIDNEKINLNRKRKFVAWIGIFQYQKNLGELYKIASQLSDYHFRIAGEAYSYIDKETEETIRNLKKLGNVFFVGLLKRDEIRTFLSEALCLLNTSRYEGFSNTYLEALSVGCPIVTRIKTDPDGLVKKNNLGITVEKYEDLSQAIIRLNYESFETEKLVTYVKKNHDPQFLVDKIEKIIGE